MTSGLLSRGAVGIGMLFRKRIVYVDTIASWRPAAGIAVFRLRMQPSSDGLKLILGHPNLKDNSGLHTILS